MLILFALAVNAQPTNDGLHIPTKHFGEQPTKAIAIGTNIVVTLLQFQTNATTFSTNIVVTDNQKDAYDEQPTFVPAVYCNPPCDWTIHHKAEPATERYTRTIITEIKSGKLRWEGRTFVEKIETVIFDQTITETNSVTWSKK